MRHEGAATDMSVVLSLPHTKKWCMHDRSPSQISFDVKDVCAEVGAAMIAKGWAHACMRLSGLWLGVGATAS